MRVRLSVCVCRCRHSNLYKSNSLAPKVYGAGISKRKATQEMKIRLKKCRTCQRYRPSAPPPALTHKANPLDDNLWPWKLCVQKFFAFFSSITLPCCAAFAIFNSCAKLFKNVLEEFCKMRTTFSPPTAAHTARCQESFVPRFGSCNSAANKVCGMLTTLSPAGDSFLQKFSQLPLQCRCNLY